MAGVSATLVRPRPRSHARGTRAAIVVLVAAPLLGLVGCGGDSADDPADQLSDFRARAAAGADASYTATYALTQGGNAGKADVAVSHTPDSLRLDISTPAGVATSITTPSGTVACQATGKAAPTCLQAAGPGEDPPAAFNPGLRDVFTSALSDLGDGFGTVEVLGTPTDTDADALCGRVTGNDVPQGLYCLLPDGVVASANFTSGALKLTSQGAAPANATFAPLATPRPRAS